MGDARRSDLRFWGGAFALVVLVGCAGPSQRLPSQPAQAAARPAVARAPSPAEQRRPGLLGRTPCNDRRVWSTTAWPLSKIAARDVLHHAHQASGGSAPTGAAAEKAARAARGAVFWWMIRAMTVEGNRHNAAALRLQGLTTASGAPLWLVRSGYTLAPDRPGSCFHALVHRAGVRHVLNLYDGEMYNADLEAGESKVVASVGGTYAHPKGGDTWRVDMRRAWKAWRKAAAAAQAGDTGAAAKAAQLRTAYERSRLTAAQRVAGLIQTHLLRPGGAAPAGHVHVHCGGGMHRTGMVVGVLDRCVNRAPMSKVSADYKRHVAWESDTRPGGFEAQNLDFIAHFPCALLKR